MRRALASLKYAPAALCGLLVVAWVVTPFADIAFSLNPPSGYVFELGGADVHVSSGVPNHAIGNRYFAILKMPYTSYLGRSYYISHKAGLLFGIPIPVVLTTLTPIAVGCLTRFRFPLWSYFAWTALVAVELAYYLR